MIPFHSCLYSFIDFTGEIDKRDERKSNGVAHWELHQTSLLSSPIDILLLVTEEYFLLFYSFWGGFVIREDYKNDFKTESQAEKVKTTW